MNKKKENSIDENIIRNKEVIMNKISCILKTYKMKQGFQAQLLGISQGRISNLHNPSGRTKLFSFEILIKYLETLGYFISYEIVDEKLVIRKKDLSVITRKKNLNKFKIQN